MFPDNAVVTILEGKNDLVLPDDNAKLHEITFKKSNIYLIPNAGHFPFIEAPNDVISILKNTIPNNFKIS